MKFTSRWEMGNIVADIIYNTSNFAIPSYTQHLLYTLFQHLLYLQCPNARCLPNISTSATYPKFIPIQPPSFLLTEFVSFFSVNDRDNGFYKGKNKSCLRPTQGIDSDCLI